MLIIDCSRHSRAGAAIVFVLGIIVVLVVLCMGFLGLSARRLGSSDAAVSRIRAAEALVMAEQQVLADLRQEINAGSVEPIVPSATNPVRYPATPAGAVPDRSSAQAGSLTLSPPNLVKQSRSGKPAYDAARSWAGAPVYPQAAAYPVAMRAAAVSSGSSRASVSSLRWNLPALLPRMNPASGVDLTPGVSGVTRQGAANNVAWRWQPPDWVYTRADAQNALAWSGSLVARNPNPVVARYAYQVYDIGGLLDLNVAGYDPDPAVVGGTVASRRGSIGLADLSEIGLSSAQLKKLVSVRNPSTLAEPDNASGIVSYGNRYANFLLNGNFNLGFVRVARGASAASITNRAFSSRQALKNFLPQLAASDSEKAALVEALQCLTHFSRGLEQPSYKPGFYNPAAAGSRPLSPVYVRPSIVPPAGNVDDVLYPINLVPAAYMNTGDIRKNASTGGPMPWEMALGNNRGGNDAWGTVAQRGGSAGDTRPLQDTINPGFLEVRVKAKADPAASYAFLRQNGSSAQIGEPLVNARFPLDRLAWLTYRGPSALLPSSDPQFNALGTAKAIYDCFGLTWTRDPGGSYFWAYDHGRMGGIFKLEELLVVDKVRGLPREPDFFELLKAAIAVGSLGKSAVATHLTSIVWDTTTYQQVRDRSTTFQVMEIGANVVDQYDSDSFPTIIKLPNPDPGLTTAAARYSPPLFTARGVEDLPYFYRFHWRGIEDAADAPNKALPAPGGINEITGMLGDYAGSKFVCGTTAILGFPELWNPHAQNGAGVPANLVPSAFRVVAASETPSDVLDPPKDPANLYDKGLATLPKLGNLPTIDSSNKAWVTFVNSGWNYFLIRPTGFFAFCNSATGWLPTWMHSQALGAQTLPGGYNTTSWVQPWPMEDIETTSLLSAPSLTLYWSTAVGSTEKPGDLSLGNRIANYFIALAPLWKLPASVTSDAAFPLQPQPAGWPPSSSRFSGKTAGPFGSVANFPATGDPTVLYLLTNGKFFCWDLSSASYQELVWPAMLSTTNTFLASAYTSNSAGLRYFGSGKTVPSPLPTYQYYWLAMSDKAGVRREFFESLPSNTIPPGTPKGSDSGNAPYNRTVELRGTELLFSLGSNSLFREPTALCQPGIPTGSGLAAGPDNYLSGAPHAGYVADSNGGRWVGFSMGDVPSQFLVASKMYTRDKTAVWNNSLDPSKGLRWATDLNDPAQDVYQNKCGYPYAYSTSSGSWMVTPTPSLPARPGPPDFYRLRFFHVPVNLAGLGRTQFVVRVQFKDPVSGKWITYDERNVDINPDYSGQWSAGPVLGKSELQLANLTAPQSATGNVAWTDNKRSIGWSLPVVTSYDPRTSRFGQPMRSAYNWPQNLRGTNARDLQLLNPSKTNIWDSGYFPKTDPIAGPCNITDRPANGVVDLPVNGTLPQTVTPRWMVPAYWNNWLFWNWSTLSLKDSYDHLVGNVPNDANGSAQWWAVPRSPLTNQPLYQMPSTNAADYGWYSHSLKSPPANSFPTSAMKGGSTSPDPYLLGFFNDGPGGYFPDSLRIGDFSENIPPSPATTLDPSAPYRQAYTDPDDVFRRASGGLAPVGGYSSAIEGLPMGQGSTQQASNRPIILNRPFRSVAEMATAFRGTPWKNLSFFMPETGDAALLDVFCLTTPPPAPSASGSNLPLVAGKVNLNTRQEPVLRAMLSGALKDEIGSDKLTGGTLGESAKAAAALVARTTGSQVWQGPLCNNAELAGKLVGKDLPSFAATDPVYTSTVYRTLASPARNPDMAAGKDRVDWHFSGFSADLDTVFGASKDRKTQRLRESVIRSLADAGQTRVWNLLLDLVVQTGSLPQGSSSLNDFSRETEARVWVSLAIDRLTGDILERQMEWVTE